MSLVNDWDGGEPAHGILCVSAATETMPIGRPNSQLPPHLVVLIAPPLP